ncbi:error-prone DNA polymerase [Chelatococcus sp. SYSU_G07232]|uniref:Error-prone DNA polymerase n=1 Tax=Chelatococcus albus TaxID=3047466 RepID=A0ABT7AHW9_9HYPH|nr:error-prone DNA polymerase [Chelatococcus sp. SYSU_G07232]MDJ1158969.1 error-prone DNA polymerase [Chelatococcus sp. SYSU_G07232]
MHIPAAPAYAELAVTTNFSFLRGASHPQEYVRTAHALGLSAIGIADRNSLAGIVRAHAEAKRCGIRLLVGARLVTTDGFEAIAYPIDRAAYGRLCRLLSAANTRVRDGEKGVCRIAFADILEASDGQVFIAMPPEETGGPFVERLAALAAAAPGRTYLGGVHRHRGDEPRRLGLLAELGVRTGAPLVAVGDVLYHDPARRPLQDVLTCIREKCTIREAGFRLEANAERHLKPAAEMARLFAGHPQALARTAEIAALCDFSLDELKYEYPDEPVPPGKTPREHLSDLAWGGARWRYGARVPDKVARLLDSELALIAELGYERYFLTIYDVVRYAEAQGILCQGRGSAANSAVCYCLGITGVDPDKSQLLFSRFLSRQRGEPPDIDVDFEHERREEVIQYLYRRYGRHRAALCATVIHYRPRSAVREVGKALGLTPDITAALADTVWGSWGEGLSDAQIRQAGLDPANPAIRQAVDLAGALVGFPRHLSQHVGGFVLTRHRLDETVPVCHAAMAERTVIEWDKDDIDTLGLMKVDVLALGMLSCIRRAFDLLRTHHGRDFPTLADVPRDDAAVYEMLSRADSVGVFQVESRAQMSMLPRLRPARFYDLVIEVAIVRPGPIQGDMVHPYLRRRDRIEPVHFPSPHPDHGPPDELEHVLKRTLGVPLFQEQAMQIAITAAGFTDDEADGLRRAMATFRHNGTVHLFRDKFIGGMVRRGYDRAFAERCFGQIEGFGEYGFPESHAASFALLVYVSAWIKCHYPEVFCAAILNSQPMGFYQPAQLVRDAREHGVVVLAPDVNTSGWDCTLEPAPPGARHGLAVRLGLRFVKGLSGEEIAERLLARRGNGFASIERLAAATGLSRHALERLAEADAFRSLGLDRRAALWAVRRLDEAGFTRGFTRGGAAKAPAAPLLDACAMDDLFPEEAVTLPDMPLGEHVAEDYLTTSLSLKAHPCVFFRPMLRRLGAVRNAEHRDAANVPDGAEVTVAGLVLMRQRPGTAKGVVFMTLEDETGIANIIVWRKAFDANRRIVMTSRFLAVRGRLQRQGLVVHVVAERFTDLTDELPRLREGFSLPIEAHDLHGRPDPRLIKSRDFH